MSDYKQNVVDLFDRATANRRRSMAKFNNFVRASSQIMFKILTLKYEHGDRLIIRISERSY